MIDKVRFTAMADGTGAEYELIAKHDAADLAGQADRVLVWLRQMDGDSPYRMSRLSTACRPRLAPRMTVPTMRPSRAHCCMISVIFSLPRTILRLPLRFWPRTSATRTTGSFGITACSRATIGLSMTGRTPTRAIDSKIMSFTMPALTSVRAGTRYRSTGLRNSAT